MNIFYVRIFLTLTIINWLSIISFSQVNEQQLPEKSRILFLLDGSGSMLGQWERYTRMEVAKRIMTNLVDSLRVNQNLELALRVYGHQFHRRYQNCTDTRLEVPFGKENHDAIIRNLNNITPKGNTPLAYSLEQAAKDFPIDDEYRNIVIIITDGLESCDGDPCQVSLALQRRGVFLKPFVVGLGLTGQYSNNFSCIGRFYDGSDIREFRSALNQAIDKSLSKATVTVELLDDRGQKTVSNINVTFLNNFTRQAAYEFIHYRDSRGRPDTVEVDPVLTYDLVVNTLPPVVVPNLTIEGGTHTVIPVEAPQGNLRVNLPSYTEYEDGVNVLVRKAGKPSIIHDFKLPEEPLLLIGIYDLEITTTPHIFVNQVAISHDETTHIPLPGPGVVNILTSVPGHGSIYQLNKEGQQRWAARIDQKKTQQALALQPGSYKLVFRADNAHGSKFTKIVPFTIRSGQSTKLNVLNR